MVKLEFLKNLIKLFLQILIIVICLAYVFADINYPNLLTRIQTIDIFLMFPALLIILLGYLFLAFRLMVLLKNYSLHAFFSSLNASIIALGINTLLPLKMGEIAKGIYLNKKIKISIHNSFSLIIWERFVDMNILALLGLVTIGLYQPEVNLQPFFVSVIFLWGGLFIYLKVDTIYKKLTFFLPDFIQNFLNQLHEALTIKRSNADIISIVILSLIIWFVYIFQIWFILDKLLLIELNTSQLLIVFIVTALGMAIPSVPGAIGIYEAAMVLSLGWFGIDKTEALVAGFVCHAFILIPCTVLSFFIIANMKMNLHAFKGLLLKTVAREVKK